MVEGLGFGVWGREFEVSVRARTLPEGRAQIRAATILRLTPISIQRYYFLKLILLEHTPLLACFVFVVRPKVLLVRRINLRKQYFYIDIGVKCVPESLERGCRADR